MRHLIPNLSTNTSRSSGDTNSENDILSNDLKYKFEAVERYLSQGQQHQQQQQQEGHLQQPFDETDDETLDSSSGVGSSSDDVAMLMSLSTAISAQHEIDSLMNGITELENMIQQKDVDNDNYDTTARKRIHDHNQNGVIQTEESQNEEIISNSYRQDPPNQYSPSIKR